MAGTDTAGSQMRLKGAIATRRAVLDDVADCPGDALLIDLAREAVIRAQDVEVDVGRAGEYQVAHLIAVQARSGCSSSSQAYNALECRPKGTCKRQ